MQRPFLLAGSAATALLALYSCSLQASLATDDDGRVVELSSLRIASTLSRWAVEMLVVGGERLIELKPLAPATGPQSSTRECGDDDAPPVAAGDFIATA